MELARTTNRVSYLDQGWSLFEDLIALCASRQRMDEAFRIAESAQARSLNADAGVAESDLTVRTVQQALPPRTAIVYYVSLRQSLLIWTITADAARVRHAPLAAQSLARRVEAYRQLLQAGRPGDEGGN